MKFIDKYYPMKLIPDFEYGVHNFISLLNTNPGKLVNVAVPDSFHIALRVGTYRLVIYSEIRIYYGCDYIYKRDGFINTEFSKLTPGFSLWRLFVSLLIFLGMEVPGKTRIYWGICKYFLDNYDECVREVNSIRVKEML